MQKHMLFPVDFTCRPCGVPPRELLLPVLEAANIPAASLVEFWEKGKLRFTVYAKDRRAAARLITSFREIKPRGIRAYSRVLPASGWRTRWKKYFKPIKITEHIRVVPLRLKKNVKPVAGVKDIYIDSSMAFGTGAHPTTSAMAGFIEGLSGKFEDFLDVGTGTGILSLVAAACGARSVRAFDVDREAVDTARENFRVNACRVKALGKSDIRRFAGKRQFDCVAANILAPVLIEAREALTAAVRPGKYLLVSGIEQRECAVFRRRFETGALRCLRFVRKRSWVSILYRKK